MKKTLAILLSVLVIFSMFGGVMAFAADGEATETMPPVTYRFVNYDGKVIKEFHLQSGQIPTEYAPANPERPAIEGEKEFIFKGWRCDMNGELYYEASTLPTVNVAEGETKIVTFTAEYSEKNIGEYQSFWNFIESIFERINLLFQYFAKWFEF